MSPSPLVLSGSQPVNSGKSRLCYVHPEDDGLMVKIVKPEARPEQLRRRMRKKHRRFMPLFVHDIQRREIAAYGFLKRRIGAETDRFIAPVHGMVETDLGPGLVTEFVRHADGSPGTALPDMLFDAEAAESVERLRRFVLEEGVAACDFSPPNVVLARNAEGRLDAKFVDGFGNAHFIPLWRLSRRIARRLARKATRKFDRKLKELKERAL